MDKGRYLSSSQSELAYEALEKKLVNLTLKPGEIYSEGELAREIEFGRTPLREALQKIAGHGLVEMISRVGVKITEIDFNRQLAILETRRVLDELIASRAARRATEEQRSTFRALAERMEISAQNGDIEAYLKLDHEFDILLDKASRNEFASKALIPLHIHCRRFWSYYKIHDDLKRTAILHEKLMRAVADGDETVAVHATDELVDYLVEFTRKALELT
ncbi:MAG: GntR family transcriptional regulator [Candidatus Marinimicrobia bacterium]|jgi:DNA-binding GntR family transcriptional regulator|nr:GntR family transcriptional regulator [Candidatus Neomarinimicrobiota bacterium]MDP6262019.1 GntR family transcriptional regulator [Candidatus Neomarinimicrobiota bacterium]MDP7474361.1 GntR family transcriptional regulator [Candidatus Neomarinimicrobiota bacterium]MEE1573452.1 GntR family transcriptional regulator [Candidatus Neomarinimicrobiota bacterium]|tara:strand:- start:2348 stop:3004 length:657 start_codon:yes stop_codon:yes gene_type:complete